MCQCVCVCVCPNKCVLLSYQQDIPAFHIYFSNLVKFAVGDTHVISRLREFGENRHSEGRTVLIYPYKNSNEITLTRVP
jgi:hypothetical protein